MKIILRYTLFGILAFAVGSLAMVILYYVSEVLNVPRLNSLAGIFLGASCSYTALVALQGKGWKTSIRVGSISGAVFFVGLVIGLIAGQIAGSIFAYSFTFSISIGYMVAGAAGSGIYCAMLNKRSKAISTMLAGAIGFTLGALVVYGVGIRIFAVSSKQVLGFPVEVTLLFVSGGAFLGAAQDYCRKASIEQIYRFNKYLMILFTILAVSLVFCAVFYAPLRLAYHSRVLKSEWTPADKRHNALQTEREKGFTGKRAPEIVTTTLDGSAWTLSDHKGKVVLLDFWATWCGPCLGALPETKALYEKFRDHPEFLMVGISLDAERDPPARFCNKEGIEWIQLFEPGKAWNNSIAESFDVKAIPELCLINKDGVVVGINLNVADADRMLEELLHTN